MEEWLWNGEGVGLKNKRGRGGSGRDGRIGKEVEEWRGEWIKFHCFNFLPL